MLQEHPKRKCQEFPVGVRDSEPLPSRRVDTKICHPNHICQPHLWPTQGQDHRFGPAQVWPAKEPFLLGFLLQNAQLLRILAVPLHVQHHQEDMFTGKEKEGATAHILARKRDELHKRITRFPNVVRVLQCRLDQGKRGVGRCDSSTGLRLASGCDGLLCVLQSAPVFSLFSAVFTTSKAPQQGKGSKSSEHAHAAELLLCDKSEG